MSAETNVLKIAVLIKQVPDINAVGVDPVTHNAVLGGDRVMNTYDAYAVGEALAIRDRCGAHVTAITAGPPAARDVLLRALATGVDEAILIDLPQHNELDSLATARTIAAEIAKHDFDLVLAGQSTDDYETGQVGPQIAETLDWPHVSLVTHVEIVGRTLRVNRDAEASKETVEAPLPSVLMVLSGRDGQERYPTLKGMMAAKKKTIPIVEIADHDSSPQLEWSIPVAVERDSKGIILQDVAADAAVSQLVSWLKEQKLI